MITLTIRKLTLTIIILTLRSDNIENKKFIETHLKFQKCFPAGIVKKIILNFNNVNNNDFI